MGRRQEGGQLLSLVGSDGSVLPAVARRGRRSFEGEGDAKKGKAQADRTQAAGLGAPQRNASAGRWPHDDAISEGQTAGFGVGFSGWVYGT
jgi:hypothetical protein